MHKIIIKNFGPIKNAEIDINGINIAIGESASGKSVVAKLIYIFNQCFYVSTIKHDNIKELVEKNIEILLPKMFAGYILDSDKYSIRYEYGSSFYIEKTYKSFTSNLPNEKTAKIDKQSSEYQKLPSEFKELLEKIAHKGLVDEFDFINEQLDMQMTRKRLDVHETIFIPATRTFISDFDNIILNVLLDDLQFSFDYSLLTFAKKYKEIEDTFTEIKSKELVSLLKGKIDKSKKILKFVPSGKRKTIPLSALSSGQKELLPLVIMLDYFLLKQEEVMLIIEEPEAHIFPSDQKKIFEALVKLYNAKRTKLFITTHSPYLLAVLNNHLYAGSDQYRGNGFRGKRVKREECNAIELKDNTANKIIDNTTGLIDAQIIEKVSLDIEEEFEGLLNE